MTHENQPWRDVLSAHIVTKGLRLTQQRMDISEVFFDQVGHANIEELFRAVRKKNPRIGYATVYRTLKLLEECGLATARQFGDGTTRFEPSPDDSHHDHLICIACGKIIEFENEEIETLQEEVAKVHRFRILEHKMEIYGECESCQQKNTNVDHPQNYP